METKKRTRQFKTEVQQLMNIIINSPYSHREIFLRELISNASDALDKLRFKAQTDSHIMGTDTELKIKIVRNKEKNTLEIADNGIGMTYDEVIENIGTIAKSGTAGFLEAVGDAKNQGAVAPELIGQFGVGFYSAFIVATSVEVVSRRPVESVAVRPAALSQVSSLTSKNPPGTAPIPSRNSTRKPGGRPSPCS